MPGTRPGSGHRVMGRNVLSTPISVHSLGHRKENDFLSLKSAQAEDRQNVVFCIVLAYLSQRPSDTGEDVFP